jgi:hypothetical protein
MGSSAAAAAEAAERAEKGESLPSQSTCARAYVVALDTFSDALCNTAAVSVSGGVIDLSASPVSAFSFSHAVLVWTFYSNAALTFPSSVSVIEAPNVNNLLAQFEAADPNCVDGPEDPKRKAQIMAAVKNHFSSSSRKFPPGRVPKIGETDLNTVLLQSPLFPLEEGQPGPILLYSPLEEEEGASSLSSNFT